MAVKKHRCSIAKRKVEYHSSSSDEEISQNLNHAAASKNECDKESDSGLDKEEYEDSENEELKDNKDGWADAMSKVLTKTGPKNIRTMILPKEKFPEDKSVSTSSKAERKKKVSF